MLYITKYGLTTNAGVAHKTEIESVLGMEITLDEAKKLGDGRTALCKEPERYKGTIVIEMLKQYILNNRLLQKQLAKTETVRELMDRLKPDLVMIKDCKNRAFYDTELHENCIVREYDYDKGRNMVFIWIY